VLFESQLGSGRGAVPFPPVSPLTDPLLTLFLLAGLTSRIRLATGITILPQRNLVYTAKHLATLDWISGGRLDVGVGIGWSRLEYQAVGVPWARRGERCDECIDIMRALWGANPVQFNGQFRDLPPLHQAPLRCRSPVRSCGLGGRRSDLLLSTLRRFVNATGGELYLVASYPDGDVELLVGSPLPDESLRGERVRAEQRAVVAGRKVEADDLIFPNEPYARRPLRPELMSRRWERRRDKVGVGHVRIHDLRRSWPPNC
jgi:hypothetical protein